jgi:hypothetical protein
MFSHGIIAGFDSALRAAWYSDAKYPLSAALYASSTLKSRLNATIHYSETGVNHYRVIKGVTHG